MLLEKLRVLGSAASWDSCGTVKQKSFRKAGIPACYSSFVHDCSATSENCRLLKVFKGNRCTHDCGYCINSSNNRKAELSPMELAKAFNGLEKKGFVQGLFLSSAVTNSPERTANKMVESARLLREGFGFKGYIHLKVLPGMPKHLVFEMAELADRLSLNLEVPSKERLQLLGSTKNYLQDLQKRLLWIDKAKRKGIVKSFTTQFILGAAGETDLEVLQKMNWLYRETSLHRTYFSAFQPIKGTRLEHYPAEKELREFQLYQADWLLREYGFGLKELKQALNENDCFGSAQNIKLAIALNNPNWFPIDVNSASRQELLRCPGIGPKTAEKIEAMREHGKFFDFKQLRQSGVILKRAAAFIEVEGSKQKRLAEFTVSKDRGRQR